MIYLEDPRNALPARESAGDRTGSRSAPGQDPLAVADGLGRPVAILRLGGRLPDQGHGRPVLLRIAAVGRLSAGAGPQPESRRRRNGSRRRPPQRQAVAPKVTNLPPPPDQAEADAKREAKR